MKQNKINFNRIHSNKVEIKQNKYSFEAFEGDIDLRRTDSLTSLEVFFAKFSPHIILKIIVILVLKIIQN